MTPQDTTPYPLLCRPVFKAKLWGGRKLERLLGKRLPPVEPIGESWEVADLPEGVSAIANGALADRSLHDAVELWAERLTGPYSYQGRFPLLVKFIHAEDDLSVQVHPSDADCRALFPGEHGKDESWLIVHAAPDGSILHGCTPGTTLETFDAHVAAGTTLECLRRVPVAAGACTRLAPGTVHAICRGVVLLEIQQPSDTTFRIDDYGRLDDTGAARPLHIAQARQVIQFGDTAAPLIAPLATEHDWGRHELVVDAPAYRIERLTLRRPASASLPADSPVILVVLNGALRLDWPTDRLDLKTGDTVIVPAAMDQLDLSPLAPDTSFVLTGLGATPWPSWRNTRRADSRMAPADSL